jgi:hypothetical protein
MMYRSQSDLWDDVSESIEDYIRFFDKNPDRIFIQPEIANELFDDPENSWIASLPVEFNTSYSNEDYFLSDESHDHTLLSSGEIIGLE